MLFEVGYGVFQERDVVEELTDADVTVSAEETSDFPRFVTVIDVCSSSSAVNEFGCSADSAPVSLRLKQLVVICGRDAKNLT